MSSVLARPASGRKRITAPRAAFGRMVLNEARLAWRQPSGIIAGIGISMLLLVVFGELPVFQKTSARLGGYSAFDVYVPILMAFAIAIIALTYLPGPLISYREQGILRRLSTTPVPASWVLAAQMVVQTSLMVIVVLLQLGVGIAFFGVSHPASLGGFILTLLLTIVALFTIGLAIAAVAKTAAAGRGIMAAAFYPLMFFAGLYYPMQLMPGALQGISDYTPLGAAVQAIGYSMAASFPPARPLLVLAGYALVFGFVARRFFRWQ
jgi:ABC-2 type transport system permease protein